VNEIASFRLRPATAADQGTIRGLIREGGINPLGLHWSRFVLAEARQGQVVGCGQIKQHRDGSNELASIAVRKEWRGQGVARAIIEHLLAGATEPLYLTCRARLGSFYEKFGFRVAPPEEMPGYFRRISWLVNVFGVLGLEKVLVMVK
jgi:amino-acid N-acetyltransferase